jgi:hypothetical protein
MENTYQSAADFIAAKKLDLAARNLQHLLKIADEHVILDNIVESLERTIIDAHCGNSDDFSDILAAQARILDAAFNYYVNKSKDAYSEDDKINIALRAQRQTDKAINTWKRIKTEKPPKPRFVFRDDKKFPERTEQMLVNNAPLDD